MLLFECEQLLVGGWRCGQRTQYGVGATPAHAFVVVCAPLTGERKIVRCSVTLQFVIFLLEDLTNYIVTNGMLKWMRAYASTRTDIEQIFSLVIKGRPLLVRNNIRPFARVEARARTGPVGAHTPD